jgi:proteasome accessory factor C
VTDLQQQITRLLLVLSWVRRHPGARLDEVAAGIGVSREVLRDELVPLLTVVGKPPFSPGDLVDVWLDGEERLHVDLDQSLGRPLRLTAGESTALRVALQGAASSGAGDYAARAQKLVELLSSLLRSEDAPVAVAAAPADPCFEVIDEGLRRHVAVDIDYYTASRDTQSRRVVEPWGLIEVAGAWYVVARDRGASDGAPRIFKLSRVREAHLTGESFSPPQSFDPTAFVAGGRFVGAGGQTLTLRADPPLAARLAEEGYTVENGVVTVPFAQPRWAAAWVMSLGGAEILGPPAVVEEVRARCQEALAAYDE